MIAWRRATASPAKENGLKYKEDASKVGVRQ